MKDCANCLHYTPFMAPPCHKCTIADSQFTPKPTSNIDEPEPHQPIMLIVKLPEPTEEEKTEQKRYNNKLLLLVGLWMIILFAFLLCARYPDKIRYILRSIR